MFLSPVLGYAAAATLNNSIHMRFGQRGVSFLSPGAHLIGYIIIFCHPPYPVLVIACITSGFGNGLADAAWNAWLGGMPNSNELLGILHGFYGAGAMLAPTIATSLITQAGWPWYRFYYIAAAMSFGELVALTTTFWSSTGEEYRRLHPKDSSTAPSQDVEPSETHGPVQLHYLNNLLKRALGDSRTAESMKNKVTWICSGFLTAYTGAEVALGGWIVTFMLRIRHGSPFASGMASTGFWAGITVGRVVLGFVTPRLFRNEKHAVAVYLAASLVLELLFWLVPKFLVSAVMVAFLGFFLGPLFPAAIVAATKLLPKHIHVSAIGFAAALGAAGATVLPFAVGAIAQVKGVWVLQPIILAILVVCLGIWLCLPSLAKKDQ